jgi:hypothetical protein
MGTGQMASYVKAGGGGGGGGGEEEKEEEGEGEKEVLTCSPINPQ